MFIREKVSRFNERRSAARRLWVAPLVVLGLIAGTVFLCAMLDARAFGVLSISPTSGPDVGGTEVTITGYHLLESPNPEDFGPDAGCVAQVYTAPMDGEYLLEMWGASGGGLYAANKSSGEGGAGGFSRGSVILEAGDQLYINVGHEGETYYDTGSTTPLPGGCNGGGAASAKAGLVYRGGGGGASDVRINSNSLFARVAVAGGGGGGGGAWTASSNASGPGGAGGGSTGVAGGNTQDGRVGGGAGTQIAGGSWGHFFDNTGTVAGAPDGTAWPGAWGVGGGAGTHASNSFLGGGGGGGWYGGGGGSAGSGGGGGSGWIYTAGTFSTWNAGSPSDASGYLLNSDFYLDHARTQSGTESFLSPTGTLETGHRGDGFVRITPPTMTASSAPVDFSYNGTTGADGTVQTYTAEGTGSYLLEVWGAEGGSNNTAGTGGRGGYSQGVIELGMGETLYVNVGGKGPTGNGASALGGWNGGGQSGAYSSYTYGSGGGATDIRVGTNDLKARAIVAGGGGGSGSNGGVTTTTNKGGAGGGTVGLPGITAGGYIGGGGTQFAGGAVGSQSTTDLINGPGQFGLGGSMLQNATGGGGGGGWYGGGAGSWEGGGGGSGWTYDASALSDWQTNSPADAAGWLLDASHYLTDAETLAGDQTFDSPIGASGVGNLGHGYARITPISITQAQMPVVTIGGNNCPIHSLTIDEIKCTTAPHAAGLVDVEVTIWNETQTLSNAFEYLDTIPPLDVTGFSPSSGSVTGGYQLVITGDGFNDIPGTPIVTIGGITIPSADVTVDSLTQMTVIVPNFLSGGNKTITVELADHSALETAPGAFEATYGITSITPNVGFAVGGATVIIGGSGFCAPNGVGGCLVPSVMFGSETATSVTVLSDSQISVVAPPNSLGTVDVVVTNGSGIIMTAVNGYTYDELAITDVDPTSGSYRGGTVITIDGTGFGNPGLVTPALYDTCGSPEIFEAPESGIYLLEAWGAQGGSENTYYANGGLGGYSIGKIELTAGDELHLFVGCEGNGGGSAGGHTGGWNGGGSTTGAGSGGGGATDVRINGSAITDRILVAGGGGGSSSGSRGGYGGGTVGETTSRRGTATGGTQNAPGVTTPSSISYSYWSPAGFGYGGDITGGTNTGGGGGGGGWFGGAAGPNDYPSYNDNDDTPGAGGSGYVFTAVSDLTGYGVNVPDTKYHLVDAQTIAGDSALNMPDVSSGDMIEGHSGNGAIRISALGVDRSVKLGTSGSGYANCVVLTWQNNEIMCKTTAHDPGLVDVLVSIGGEVVELADAFTYVVPAPVANSIYPTAGPTAGGVVIKIEGSNFVGNAIVTVGGTACVKTLIAEQVIYCVAPAGVAGAAQVVVTTTGGSATAGTFTYNAPMVVDDITPIEGPTAGGTDVTITGANFVATNKWAIDAAFSNNGTGLAIDEQGRLYGWGYNGNGDTGTGSSNYEVRTPTLVNGNGDMSSTAKIVSVWTSSSTSYAIDIDGNLYAWGYGGNGNFGNCEVNYSSNVPVKLNGVCPGSGITSGTKIVSGAATYTAGFAIDTAGNVYSWGYNVHGQLGNGIADYNYQTVPTRVLGDQQYVQIAVGNGNYALAIDIAGDLYVWGSNGYGQLGQVTPGCMTGQCLTVPTQLTVPGSSGVFTSIAASYMSSLVADSNGDLFSFGGNEYGTLGLGLNLTYDNCYNSSWCIATPTKVNGATDGSIPNAISGSTNIIRVVAADYAVAAMDDAGYIYTWGSDNQGLIGNGSTEYVNSCNWDSDCVAAPYQLASFGTNNQRLIGGQTNFAVIRHGGALYAWGNSNYNMIINRWRVEEPTLIQMFAPSMFMVRFGAASASLVTVVDSSTITARSPRHDAGLVDVSVVNSDIVGTLEDAYTYIAPAIGSIVPNFGPVEGGTEVTISGHGFGDSILPIATGFNRNITSVLDSNGYPIFFILENDGTITRVTGEPGDFVYETIDTTAVSGNIVRLEGWWGLTDAGDAFLLPATDMAVGLPVATSIDMIFDVTLPAGGDPTVMSMLYASNWQTGEITMVTYDVSSETIADTQLAALFDGLPDCEIKGGLLLLYCDDNTVWIAGDGNDATQLDTSAVTAPIVEIGIIEQGMFGPSFLLDAEGGLYYLDLYNGDPTYVSVDTSITDGGIMGVDTSGTVFWDAGGNLYVLDGTNSLTMFSDELGTGLHTVVIFMISGDTAVLGAIDMEGNMTAVIVDTSNGDSDIVPYGQIAIPEPQSPVESPVVFDYSGTPAYCEIVSWSNTQIVCNTAAHVAELVTVDVKNGRYNSAHMAAEYIDDQGSLVSASNVASGFLYQDVYIELVVSDDEINLVLSPAVSHSYDSTTLTVETNADNGYKLSFYVDGATADMICTEDFGRVIGPGSGTLADNTWGYAIGTTPSSWSLPTTSNTQIDSYGSATLGRDTIFNAGGRITPLTPACNRYQAELVFTAEANL